MPALIKPVFKLKVDELFLRWLGDQDTLSVLKENLGQVQRGEPLFSQRVIGPTIRKPNGHRPNSPLTPPCSPHTNKVPSPRSPRKHFRKALSEDREKRHHTQPNSVQRDVPIDDINLNNNNTLPGNRKRKPASTSLDTPHESPRPISAHGDSIHIPTFHFPQGRPPSDGDAEKVLDRITDCFKQLDGGKAYKHQMGAVAQAAGLSFYWRTPLFLACGGDQTSFVTLQKFTDMWTKLTSTHHDQASRFMALLAKPGQNFLVADDFVPLIQDIVDSHSGLAFLVDAPEFHSRYVHTVIARIMYCVNRSWTGRITVPELRRSNLLEVLSSLQEEEDINQVTEYFSYEHFYVIYCKFWELDKDHDLLISKEDLARHNDQAISSRMIDRIFSGAVTRGAALNDGKMSYPEFVWFLISEEDKKHPTSREYWFRCMDLDGDGYISMYEMEYFYEEQAQRMEAMGIETLPFEDIVCQMLDMVKPKTQTSISRADLRACKMTDIFYDTFFNLEKYLDHEQRDPFSNLKDNDSDEAEMSDWEKYAAEEYEILVAEEGANQGEDELHYEEDFEAEDDEELQAIEDEFKLAKSQADIGGAAVSANHY